MEDGDQGLIGDNFHMPSISLNAGLEKNEELGSIED
jgi:hypothetical protein